MKFLPESHMEVPDFWYNLQVYDDFILYIQTYINNLKVDNIIGMIQGSGTSINLKSKPVA